MLHNEQLEVSKGLLLDAPGASGSSVELPPEAVHILERLKVAGVPASLPMLQLSAMVYVGGYVTCVIRGTCDMRQLLSSGFEAPAAADTKSRQGRVTVPF
ncbi:hypothetical protein MTO96_025440 [Rhipicephalus appendiculatus]